VREVEPCSVIFVGFSLDHSGISVFFYHSSKPNLNNSVKKKLLKFIIKFFVFY